MLTTSASPTHAHGRAVRDWFRAVEARVELLEATVVEEKLARKRRATFSSEITPQLTQITADSTFIMTRWRVYDASPLVREEGGGVHLVTFGGVDDDWLGVKRSEGVFACNQRALTKTIWPHPKVDMQLLFVPPVIFTALARILEDEVFLKFWDVHDAPHLSGNHNLRSILRIFVMIIFQCQVIRLLPVLSQRRQM